MQLIFFYYEAEKFHFGETTLGVRDGYTLDRIGKFTQAINNSNTNGYQTAKSTRIGKLMAYKLRDMIEADPGVDPGWKPRAEAPSIGLSMDQQFLYLVSSKSMVLGSFRKSILAFNYSKSHFATQTEEIAESRKAKAGSSYKSGSFPTFSDNVIYILNEREQQNTYFVMENFTVYNDRGNQESLSRPNRSF
ncbi:hypothetical protein BJV82DRAFT_657588 [Fennellomyces sp. T-0311]|nr:hypothetical protein BJV82DRAFT_657588 [Fennellomyces sp. T-0311]